MPATADTSPVPDHEPDRAPGPDNGPEPDKADEPDRADGADTGSAPAGGQPSATPEEATADRSQHGDAGRTSRRTVWRCAPQTMAVVAALMLIIGIGMPAAAGYGLLTGAIGIGPVQIVLVSIVGVLALLALFYGWRLALHPRLLVEGDMVVVINPFRQHDVHFESITLIAPGGDGLMIATRYETVEAWCVQKSALAARTGRHTRADRICDELWDIWERYHQIETDPDSPVRIGFARPGRQEVLTEIEKSATLAQLGHIFPPDDHPYPDRDVQDRWASVLTDRNKHTLIAYLDAEPVGYAAYDADTVLHLGVHADHQRRGIGSALLQAALDELYADAANRYAYLWVLQQNHGARAFYTDRGWTDTGETKPSEFEPYPTEVEMARPNPHSARRSR